ncbi:coatomer subunit zeta [Nematocida sp. LUAm2]|nr:coatomer subunit zeta [Nematocida sp. LUAm2]
MNHNIVTGLAIFGEGGERLIGTPISPDLTRKEEELKMFTRAKESDESILLLDDHLVLYKIVEDLCILLYAPVDENEIMLSNALDSFYSSTITAIKSPLTQKNLLKHYDQVFLLINAFIYKTLIISDSSTELSESLPKRTFESLDAMQINASKVTSAWKKAQQSFTSSWFKK